MTTNRNTPLQITIAGTLSIDISKESAGERTGAKRPVRYQLTLGGAAGNMLRALAPLGLRINVHSGQHPAFAPWIRDEVRKLGGTPFITEREDALAMSVIEQAPNGGSELDVHRPKLRYADIANPGFEEHAHASALTILGPIADAAEAVPLMETTARSARRAVMVPHPGVLAAPGFGALAGQMAGIVLNRAEASLLTPGYEGSEAPALKMRHLTAGKPDIVVSDGPAPVLAWAENLWHRKQPENIGPLSRDFGAGDRFAARYAYYRFVLGKAAGVALDDALDDVAEFLRAAAESPALAPGKATAPTSGIIRSASKNSAALGGVQGRVRAAVRGIGLFIGL